MANEQGKTEVVLPETIKVGDKEVPLTEMVDYYKNKAKFETDYAEKGRKLNEAEREKQALAAEMAALKGQKPKAEDDPLPPFESDDYLASLDGTVRGTAKQLAEMRKELEGLKKERQGEIHERVNRTNLRTLRKFVSDNKDALGIESVPEDPEKWPEELKELTQTAAYSRHNRFPTGSKIPEVDAKALDDALILLHRESLLRRSKEAGERSIIDEIIGKKRQAEGKKPTVEKEPDMKWLNENWNSLSDEEREKYYEKVFGRKPVK